MLKEFLLHKGAYLALITGLILFLCMFSLVWPDKKTTQMLIFLLMFFYITWGIVVHTKSSHATLKIVLEYIAVAALAGACLALLVV